MTTLHSHVTTGTAAEWAGSSAVLDAKELGLVVDDDGTPTAVVVGDGTTPATDLVPADLGGGGGLVGATTSSPSGATPSVDLSALTTAVAILEPTTGGATVTITALPDYASFGPWVLQVRPNAGGKLVLPGSVDDLRQEPGAFANSFDLQFEPNATGWTAYDLGAPDPVGEVIPSAGGGYATWVVLTEPLMFGRKIPDQGSPITVVLFLPPCDVKWRRDIVLEAQTTPDTVSGVFYTDDGMAPTTVHWLGASPADADFVTGLRFTAWSIGDGDAYATLT